jgi:signal transduction histidine kinase
MRRPFDQQRAIEALYRKLRFDIALYRPDGTIIAMAGRPPPRFDPARARQGWRRGPGRPELHPAAPRRTLAGRTPGARTGGSTRPSGSPLSGTGGAGRSPSAPFPWCAGLSRRLERLKAGVEQFGNDLGARVKGRGPRRGRSLAQSFNRSAERIEQLVAAHRMLLANCSHELRTPLARIAVAASLLAKAPTPRRANR